MTKDTLSVILKTAGGIMCVVSLWLLVVFMPIPDPRTYMNSVLAFIGLTSFFVGVGLLISAVMEP